MRSDRESICANACEAHVHICPPQMDLEECQGRSRRDFNSSAAVIPRAFRARAGMVCGAARRGGYGTTSVLMQLNIPRTHPIVELLPRRFLPRPAVTPSYRGGYCRARQ